MNAPDHPRDTSGGIDAQIDVLAVDLDGTLLRSDMLYESFWSASAADCRVPLRAVAKLGKDRAALKQYLGAQARIDVTTLPFDEAVIEYVQAHRAEGTRAVLVTASDQAIADSVAAHLGIFDEVHGSDGNRNLKGPRKAAFLKQTYDGLRLGYMGDSTADLAVWKVCDLAIPVNASAGLTSRVDELGIQVVPLNSQRPKLKSYLKALRPHQWLKNALVFLPMLAAHQLTQQTITQTVLAFVLFSLIASSVYVLNDLIDLRADRAHPRKRLRPFAAGAIPISHGTLLAIAMLTIGAALSFLLGTAFALVMLFYFLATAAYSLNLKRRAVVDICTLAALYTMRIVAGGVATGITLSVWLLAFSIFFFFSMAAIKRQAELVDMAARGKLSADGRGYDTRDLDVISMMAVGAGYVSIMVMMLYVNSPAVLELYSFPPMLWGICFVLLYWISRIAMLTHRGHMHDDPVVFAARDRNSQICAVLILGFAITGAVL